MNDINKQEHQRRWTMVSYACAGIVVTNALLAVLELATGNWLGAVTNASIAGMVYLTKDLGE